MDLSWNAANGGRDPNKRKENDGDFRIHTYVNGRWDQPTYRELDWKVESETGESDEEANGYRFAYCIGDEDDNPSLEVHTRHDRFGYPWLLVYTPCGSDTFDILVGTLPDLIDLLGKFSAICLSATQSRREKATFQKGPGE